MKHTFIEFPKRNLPRIYSRRLRIGQGHHNICYKSDSDDDDDDEEALKKKLKALEKSLSDKLGSESKSEIEKQIKAAKEELQKLQEKAAEDVPKLRKELDEAKATIVVMKDAADKNQRALDDLLAKQTETEAGAKKKVKSFNTLLEETINDAENMKKLLSVKDETTKSTGKMSFKAVGDMSFSANFSTADVSVTQLRPGIIELPRRKLHIRELLQGGAMSTSNFAYLKEKTTGEGNPATVAEGNWKEQLDIDLDEVSVPAEYIAGYLVCSRKMFDDIPAFVSFLQRRLLEKLLRAEDVQLLYGNGSSPNLSGITNSGNFLAPDGTATIDELQLVEAISQLEMQDRDANGILVSPKDYYRIFEYTASSSGEFTYTRLSTIVNGQLYIAGVPVYRSTALGTDKFIVGDWNEGANIITREAPRVEIFYEDGNNVRRNQVTVRVEERIAFPIYGNNYFIYGDFGHS